MGGRVASPLSIADASRAVAASVPAHTSRRKKAMAAGGSPGLLRSRHYSGWSALPTSLVRSALISKAVCCARATRCAALMAADLMPELMSFAVPLCVIPGIYRYRYKKILGEKKRSLMPGGGTGHGARRVGRVGQGRGAGLRQEWRATRWIMMRALTAVQAARA